MKRRLSRRRRPSSAPGLGQSTGRRWREQAGQRALWLAPLAGVERAALIGLGVGEVHQPAQVLDVLGLDQVHPFGLQPEETKLWFGIISLIVVEMGLITPPVGLNVFVINSMAKDVPMIETFKGVVPFFMTDGIRVAFIVAFPTITLLIPHLLYVE